MGTCTSDVRPAGAQGQRRWGYSKGVSKVSSSTLTFSAATAVTHVSETPAVTGTPAIAAGSLASVAWAGSAAEVFGFDVVEELAEAPQFAFLVHGGFGMRVLALVVFGDPDAGLVHDGVGTPDPALGAQGKRQGVRGPGADGGSGLELQLPVKDVVFHRDDVDADDRVAQGLHNVHQKVVGHRS